MSPRASHCLDAQGALQAGVIVLGLGGNLGGVQLAQKRCIKVIEALSTQWGPAAVSRFFVTAPVGEVQEQPDFLNAVATWRPANSVAPRAALALLQELEHAHGRERLVAGGARTLDLDLLLVGQQVRSEADLELPHPRMHQRSFVLSPMQDLFGADFRWSPDGPSVGECLAKSAVASQRIRPL